ncbi:MAG: hypothetical protein A2Z47_08490 [Thermodesulfovibrio sp. RBG_19FT_COMBO_42_12]|nr:MAG: hypothetical protein A2Z47_08490 [Thermodesulfovibrio sp. RBG_19FT_COMBO_42_12]
MYTPLSASAITHGRSQKDTSESYSTARGKLRRMAILVDAMPGEGAQKTGHYQASGALRHRECPI